MELLTEVLGSCIFCLGLRFEVFAGSLPNDCIDVDITFLRGVDFVGNLGEDLLGDPEPPVFLACLSVAASGTIYTEN